MPLALISPPLVSQPGEAAPEEILRRPPREAWPLARVLGASLVRMGRMACWLSHTAPQAGKSGDPRSQNADVGVKTGGSRVGGPELCV